MPPQELVRLLEALDDVLGEVGGVHRLALELGAVVGARRAALAAHQAHGIAVGVLHHGHGLGRELSGLASQPAHVHSRASRPAEDEHGQHAHGDDGAIQLGPGALHGGLARVQGEPLVEERLQVHEHGVLARGDEVLQVEVHGRQQVEQRQRAALPPVEALEGLARVTARGLHVLDPAMGAAVQHGEHAVRMARSPRVERLQELLETDVHRERLRLVDELQAGAEPQQHHAPALAVEIRDARLEASQGADVPAAEEGLTELLTLAGEAIQELEAHGEPALGAGGEQAGEHRVLLQQGHEYPRLLETHGGEVVEALLGRAAGQLLITRATLSSRMRVRLERRASACSSSEASASGAAGAAPAHGGPASRR